MKVFIVESPGKVKKIQGFLGSGYKVMASVGHIRDLPEKDMGVEPPQFKPKYVVTKPDVVKKLKEAVKGATHVYLATDPDREGESIAWHLAEALRLDRPHRVTYTEITEAAVKNALLKTREIDLNLVAAQEGRRVLDRQVGYMVSPALSGQIGDKVSAGRVQSPAVRLVVERERAIREFSVTNHFGVELVFAAGAGDTTPWKAVWLPKQGGWLAEDQEFVLDEEAAKKVAAVKPVTVRDCRNSKSTSAPPAPFTTSTLQQAASAALKINPATCMSLAQSLYEGGHITYMRTDSPNLSDEAIAAIRAWASRNGHKTPPLPRKWPAKESAQEAHEAIRPTHIEVETAGNTEDEKALYALIRLRAIVSQLVDAEFAVRTLTLVGDADGREVVFEAKGKTLAVPGWRALVAKDQTDESEDEEECVVPELLVGASLSDYEGKVVAKKTKPPARYTEAALVRELEKRGIGRPSTYASILDNIIKR
ncbi:MAG: type I DNA topoisomerase, partial [Schwartzia sp.]|nr:type I DNA topoisomerase [Schwartzia sp. (in: firmicutes)]